MPFSLVLYAGTLTPKETGKESMTKFLLLDGGTQRYFNYYRYYNSVRKGYEILRSQNRDISIFAKDGTWNVIPQFTESLSTFSKTKEGGEDRNLNLKRPNYPPIRGSLKDLDDFKMQLRKISKDLKEGDSLILYLTGHGGAPESEDKPETASYSLWNMNEITFKELAEILRPLDQKKIKLKVVSETCFSGGVHYLSRTLKNVCTLGSTIFSSSSSSGDPMESIFSQNFWKKMDESSGELSFSELAFEALTKDWANLNLGSLSSLDFINFKLHLPPYQKKLGENGEKGILPPTVVNVAGIGSTEIFEAPQSFNLNLTIKTWLNEDYAILKNLFLLKKGDPENSCTSDHFLKKNKSMTEILKEIINPFSFGFKYQQVDLGNFSVKYSDQINKYYKDILNNSSVVLDQLNKDENEFIKLQNEYQDLTPEEREQQYDSFYKKVEVIRKRIQPYLKNIIIGHQMVSLYKKLPQFNEVSTEEDKIKLRELLECEWEQL